MTWLPLTYQTDNVWLGVQVPSRLLVTALPMCQMTVPVETLATTTRVAAVMWDASTLALATLATTTPAPLTRVTTTMVATMSDAASMAVA